MNTKIHTVKDIPSALFEGNPHEVATTAWWKWRDERTNRLSRQVIVSSSYPDGRPQGAQTNEGSLVPDFLPMLRKEGAVWFYLDEALAALSSQPDAGANPASNAQEIETLRKQVKHGIEREIEYRHRLAEIASNVTNALCGVATPTL